MSVVAIPSPQGGVEHSLSRLAAILDEGCEGVLVITCKDGRMQFALHGEMRSTDLAYVGAVFLKWATEHEE